MIYYFISYIWKNFVRGGTYSQSELTGFKWRFGETITTTHPVQWLVDIRNDYGKTEDHGNIIIWNYALIGWQEVSKEIYDIYKDEVG